MKTLFLVRHAKAELRKAKLPDFQRALVKDGEKKASGMAKKLKKEGFIPDLMISSSATRALETARLFAKNLGYSKKAIVIEDALYNETNPKALLSIVQQADDKQGSIMLFGHNPAFPDFASFLVKEFAEDIPKTGIVGIQFDTDMWKDISRGSGKLEFFEYPKKLSKTYKRLELELQSQIALGVQDILDKKDLKSAKKMKKAVKKTSSRMAKDFLKILKAERAKDQQKILSSEKANGRKETPKSRKKPESESASKTKTGPEPKSKPKLKPLPKRKPVPETKSKSQPKPRRRTKSATGPKPKPGSVSKPRAKTPKITKSAAQRTSRQVGSRKQTAKTRVSRARKTASKARSAAQGAKKRG